MRIGVTVAVAVDTHDALFWSFPYMLPGMLEWRGNGISDTCTVMFIYMNEI